MWDRDAVIREIEQEDEDIRRVKAELQARSERYVAETFAALRGAFVKIRLTLERA